VADKTNNAIRKLDLDLNQTITFATNGINRIYRPVGVAVDGGGSLYVLNQGDGVNGNVLTFNQFGNFLGTNASGLANANGIALDAGGNIFVTVNNVSIIKVPRSGPITTIATIPDASAVLQGITVRDDGVLAVCDSGRHVILLVDPATGSATRLTGILDTPGDQFGTSDFAQFNQPRGLANAGDGWLVVTDYGNNRVKKIDPSGTVCNLYGVCSNNWISGSGTYPGWFDGNGCPCEITCQICDNYAEARWPAGAVVAPGGDVYTTEDFYHLIRHTTGTGLTGPGVSTGGGTNILVAAPTISPNSGYYPMGQLITVFSPNPNVHYTIDGTEPTISSPAVTMINSVGVIHWFNSTNDLTGLGVKAFVGTNGSATVRGVPVTSNNIGTPPGPSANGALYGGIGSTIVIPVVSNLRTNDQVKSFQFRVEITPNGGAPMIPTGFDALDITSNDFVRLVTAVQGQGTTTGRISVVSYTIGSTVGLQITAIGNSGNTFFQRFATVALLKIPVPPNANEGDSYSVAVLFPSATSDGVNNPVSLTPMPAATITASDIPYTVGDSASPYGGWYNAGTFGDGDLANADVNNAFYVAAGLRVPYAFSDVFNAMDAYPPDAPGFVGGDGTVRFLDWQVILRRSLRLDPSNWARSWSPGGNLINTTTNLTIHAQFQQPRPLSLSPWYRQVLLGAVSLGYTAPGSQISVPVYVKLGDGSTLSGLQFRAIVTPQNGIAPLSQAAQFAPAPGITAPSIQQSFEANSAAFGWSLGSFSFQSRSSNFLGWLRFMIPANATTGLGYSVSFANADGSPDLNTQYNFETRSASVAVSGPALSASICSDEWKMYFFGSVTAPNAADAADPDGDGVPNWMEFLAGTDPTNKSSKFRFTSAQRQTVNGQRQVVLQWLSAQGKAYELQWSSSPAGAGWNVLGTVSGNGTITSYTDNASGASRCYRLRVLP